MSRLIKEIQDIRCSFELHLWKRDGAGLVCEHCGRRVHTLH